MRDVKRFYRVLSELEKRVGGKRKLKDCHSKMNWPERGVYFFFERGEKRNDSGKGLRVVRVGTHMLKKGGKQTFWRRLSQHKSKSKSFGASIFRKHVGEALLLKTKGRAISLKGKWWKSISERAIKDLANRVSDHIGNMPFLWLAIDDPAGPKSKRAYIERNSIALLSNCHRRGMPVDVSSKKWLGKDSRNSKISDSGLWNVKYVDKGYEPDFLNTLEKLVGSMKSR